MEQSHMDPRSSSASQAISSEVLFDGNPQPMWIFDMESLAFVKVNRAAEFLYGYTANEFMQMTIADVRPPEDLTLMRTMLGNANEEYNKIQRIRHRKKNGDILYVLLHTHDIEYNGRNARHVMITDVTGQMEAENQLRTSEAKFHVLFDTMLQGVVYQNADGIIIDANTAAQKILGLSLEQMQGRTSIDPRWRTVHGDGSPFPGQDHPSMKALKTGKPVENVEMGVFNPYLEAFKWLLVSAIPLFEQGADKPYMVYASFTDITAQKEIERNLSAEVNRRKALFSKSIDGMVVIDRNRAVVEANQSFADMLGYTPEEILNLKVWDWDYVYDSEAKTMVDYPQLPTESGFMVTKARRKNGDVIDVEVTWLPLEWNSGPNLIYIFKDVTERKTAEQNLRLSEERFQKIFLSNPAAISLIDPKSGVFVDVNPSFERLFECPKELAVGQNALQLGLADNPKGITDLLGQMLAHINQPPYEIQAKTILGNNLYLLHAVVLTKVGEQELLISSLVDITEQHRALSLLQRSEERYKFIAESVEDVIWVIDLASFTFDYVSPAVEKLRGYTAQEVMSQPVEKTLTPESAQKVKELLATNLPLFMAGDLTKRTSVAEVEQPTKWGSVVATEVVTTLVLDEKGNPSKVFGVSRNISYRKKEEKRRVNIFKLLDICNHAAAVEVLISDVIAHMIEVVGCDSVSFMAKQSARYPQFRIERGAGTTKLAAEICSDRLWGEPASLPSNGCICFNVLNGFACNQIQHGTRYGSVWTDEVPSSFKGQYPCVKNTDLFCAYKQKESVLWIPVKSGDQIIGLLQFDDSKKAFFNADMVEELESMADYVSISLAKLNSEHETKESALFLSQVIKGANEGIVVFDVDGHIRIWNPYLAELAGINEEEVIGMMGSEVFPTLCMEPVAERIGKALDGQRNSPTEYVLYNARSNAKYVVWEVMTPLYNIEGSVNGAIGIIRNITNRKKAETQAQTFSRLYATLSQVNQVIARTSDKYELFQIICDVSVEYGQFNLAWIGEYDSADHTVVPVASKGVPGVSVPFEKFYLNQPPFDKGITCEAIFSRNVAFCKDILKDEGMAHWQDMALKGSFHSVASIPLFLNGDVAGIFSLYASDVDFFNTTEEADLIKEMGLDISYALDAMDAEQQRQHAVERLNETSERLSLATKAAQIGVWDWDLTNNDLIWNDVMYGLYEFQPSEGLNLIDEWMKFVVPEDRCVVEKTMQQANDGQNAGELEFRVLLRSGETKFFRSSWTVMRNQEGKAIRMTGINADISSRVQAVQERIAREAAEQANKAKSEFLANMSHEIRTPMNAIIGFSELLYKSVAEPKQRQQIESIRTSGKSLLTIINDILDLSKIEAGKMNLEPDMVDLPSMLGGIKQLFSEKLGEKDLPLHIKIDSGIPNALMLDETRLNQILINLVNNAIKFTHKGEVAITAEVLDKGTQHLDLCLKVADTGIGISPEEQKLVFDPFYQTKGQLQKKYGGTGLGLAITKRLVEMMGGSIGLESQPGKGTEFTIVLPHVQYADSMVGENVADHDLVHCQFDEATVLVADDNAENRQLVSDILAQYHLNVLQASNGAEALEKAVALRPQLVLMDLRMPEMNGYEASSAIKGNKRTANIPIVAVSASPDVKMSPRANTVLFDDFLMKPIAISRMLEVLRKFLKHTVQGRAEAEIDSGDMPVPSIVLTPELTLNLGKLIRSLETKYLADYRQALESPNAEHIEIFGKELELIGQTSGCDYLALFGKNLSHWAAIDKLPEAMEYLAAFPNIIDDLKALQINGDVYE